MKKLLVLLSFALTLASAQAAQTLRPMSHGSLLLVDKSLVARGIVGSKEVSSKISFLRVKGSVAGLECGENKCTATLSLNSAGDIILNSQIDVDSDGNIDGREKTIAGSLEGNKLNFSLPLEFTYVIQRYSLVERMLGLKNSKFVSVSIFKA